MEQFFHFFISLGYENKVYIIHYLHFLVFIYEYTKVFDSSYVVNHRQARRAKIDFRA